MESTHSGHLHNHSHSHSHSASKTIIQVLVVTVIFMIIELVGGFMSNSLALLSDAGHMLTDVGALLVSLFALWMARRPITITMSFGYHRAEILGALVSGLLIWFISGLLVYEAIGRFRHAEVIQGRMVFIIATLGLAANLVCMKMLHSGKKENLNMRAAYLHMVADSLGSIGAIVAGLVLWLTNWHLIDPIISIFFAILMLYSSWYLIKEAVAILMESTPSTLNPVEIEKDLLSLEEVQGVHDLHIWSISSGINALSVHLITPNETILAKANALLKERYGIIHTTIQLEHPDRFDY
jgi:cobalt-zinc-cadmium efflux system protein